MRNLRQQELAVMYKTQGGVYRKARRHFISENT